MRASRHAEIAKDKLRKESKVEADEDDARRDAGPDLRIKAAGDFGPPVMEAAQIPHDSATDHDVMKVGNDEVGIGHVHVDRQRERETAR